MGVIPEAAPGTRQVVWLRRLAWASLAVNVLIVVSGGVVRLTGSGLGCPTWPRCTEESFTPHAALGVHGAIEFGNRLVTFVLVAVAVATFVAAWRTGTRPVRRLALVLLLGVPAQAVIGGVTVLTGLNPWTVSLHLLVSLAMVSVAVVLVDRVVGAVPDDPLPPVGVRWLALATYVAGWAVLYAGTVVTGSGPHAGDADARRNGLDPRSITQLHTDLVFLLLGLTVATVLVLRSVPTAGRLQPAATALLVVELGQGAIGFVQYFTGLPVVAVALHLLGAALTAAALTWVLVASRQTATGVGAASRATTPSTASPNTGTQRAASRKIDA